MNQDKTVPISAKKIINIICYSFLSTIILDLFSSKQSLVLAVGIIYNSETWKVRNYISYCIFTNMTWWIEMGQYSSCIFQGIKELKTRIGNPTFRDNFPQLQNSKL